MSSSSASPAAAPAAPAARTAPTPASPAPASPVPASPAPASSADPAARPPAPAGIDPRGPRFTAGVSALLAITVLLLGDGAAAAAVLAVLFVSFLLGVVRGPAGTWTGWVFRAVVRPRLTPPTELEDPRPPRFAQLVGLVLSGLGLLVALVGFSPAIPVAAAPVLVASFLNAAFGLCLGCELYLLGLRLRARRAGASA